MKILQFITMIIDMVGSYLTKHSDEQKLKQALQDQLDKAFQKFSSDVAEGNEDAVSEQISDLVNKKGG